MKKKTKGVVLIGYIGWIGAILMLLFSCTLIIPLGITGLAFLTVQAISQKMFNLVLLNIASIGGLIFNLIW